MSLAANQTVILTGASMGIGEALAIILAKRGLHLVLNARSADKLEAVADACARAAADADRETDFAVIPGDAADADIIEACVETAATMPGFSGFIHAAGVLAPGPLLHELPPETFDEVMGASVFAAHRLVRFAVPRLPDGSLAVFFGSGASEIAQPGIAAYCAAKAAEEHLARQVTAECPMLTTVIWRPGIVETRMQLQARESQGGGAVNLHEVFRPWKEKGELLSP